MVGDERRQEIEPEQRDLGEDAALSGMPEPRMQSKAEIRSVATKSSVSGEAS